MPTVCIDCRYATSRPSGIGELVTQLAKHAPGQATDLDFVLIRHASRSTPIASAANVREIITSSPANGPGTMWFLPRLIDLSRVDLFHAPANILPARLGMKTLTTIHDIMWLTHPHWCNPTLYGQVERAFYAHGIKRALRTSHHIAAVSEATRKAIAEHAPKAAARISVTQSGVCEEFHPKALEAQLPANIRPPFVLIVGQNAPYKNHAGAMRAFAQAFAERRDVKLVLVQRRRSARGSLDALARELGISDLTHFLGSVDRPELASLYRAAAALLHPSLCEGFGNPVAEAMACGCPVITSNRSAMPEVAGGAAQLVDPLNPDQMAQALREIVLDPSIAAAMSKAGIARAAQLRWENFAAANVALYRKLLA